MTREGWICPTCKRGISPDHPHCDHGEPISTVVPKLPLRPKDYGLDIAKAEREALIRKYERVIGGVWPKPATDADLNWWRRGGRQC